MTYVFNFYLFYFIFPQRSAKHLVYTVLQEGAYLLSVSVKQSSRDYSEPNDDQSKFFATLKVSMRGPYGFLSATNWPLLHVICFNKIKIISFNIIKYHLL